MSELLDGLLWCNECELPMLSDGKGHYDHIDNLSISRIRELVRDKLIADKLADWFINLKGKCSDCGEETYPFAGITKEEFMAHVRTRAGADDFARAIKDFLR
ncbi:hypothetical protein ES708_12098 [subsurface metagenome]